MQRRHSKDQQSDERDGIRRISTEGAKRKNTLYTQMYRKSYAYDAKRVPREKKLEDDTNYNNRKQHPTPKKLPVYRTP